MVLYKGDISERAKKAVKEKGVELKNVEDHKRESAMKKVNEAIAKKGIGLQFIKSKDPVAVQAKRFTKEPTGPSRNSLMLQAKEKGVKNFRVLNKEELIEALTADQARIDEIVKGAVARWKAGWGSKAAAAVVMLLMLCNMAFADLPTEGEASFYTVESCHKEGTSGITASHEPLDDNALTCALPSHYYIGKWFRVTNIENGKAVVVRCNDFGPNAHLVYEHNRIIDLSLAAFRKIAEEGDGTAQVKIEEVK